MPPGRAPDDAEGGSWLKRVSGRWGHLGIQLDAHPVSTCSVPGTPRASPPEVSSTSFTKKLRLRKGDLLKATLAFFYSADIY